MDILVDSNVLLRSVQPAHPHYPIASAAIAALLKEKHNLCIVRQNLVEFWAVVTRPAAQNGLGMTPAAAAAELRRLRSIFTLLEGAPGTADAWARLVERHEVSGKQAHDAHLVAAMQVYGVRELLTFNAEDFKRYGSVHVLAPEAASKL